MRLPRSLYGNLALGGTPSWGEEAKRFGREIQKNLGLEPMEDPIHPAMAALTTPEEDEARLRAILPPWQKNYTSDDYTEYTWHCPTARLYVGRAMLASPQPGYQYPAWVWNALGGFPATIDPTVQAAARAIAGSLVDLMTDPQALAAAQAEFRERTGGGVGGKTGSRLSCRRISRRRSITAGPNMSARRAAQNGGCRGAPDAVIPRPCGQRPPARRARRPRKKSISVGEDLHSDGP